MLSTNLEKDFFLNHIVLSWTLLSKRNGNKFKSNTIQFKGPYGSVHHHFDWYIIIPVSLVNVKSLKNTQYVIISKTNFR